MKQILAAIGIFIILAVLGFIFYQTSTTEKRIATRELKAGNAVFQVEIADTPALRAKGLSDRPYLDQESGMLFIFQTSGVYGFWMKDMQFPLDLVWISNNKVIGMVLGAEPEAVDSPTVYNPPGPVDKVLELNSGVVVRAGIKTGDMIELH